MPRINIFKVDYTNLEAVKKLAKQLGATVIKMRSRSNYNIVPTSRIKEYESDPDLELIHYV